MRDAFIKAVKSTIDKLGNDLALAQSTTTRFVDLDDSTAVEEVMTSTDSAIIWELSSFGGAPRDPLYAGLLNIGARTTNDAANYSILGLVGKIEEVFSIGSVHKIADYTGAIASTTLGVLYFTKADLNPQVFDRVSGIRLITLSCRAQRYV